MTHIRRAFQAFAVILAVACAGQAAEAKSYRHHEWKKGEDHSFFKADKDWQKRYRNDEFPSSRGHGRYNDRYAPHQPNSPYLENGKCPPERRGRGC